MLVFTIELGKKLIPLSRSNYGRILTGLLSPPSCRRQRWISSDKRSTSPITKYKSVLSYLEYARASGVSPDSTVFKGNVYELTTMELLQENLWLSNILHQGGAHDKGIDLRANWDLTQFKPEDCEEVFVNGKTIKVNSRRIKPLVLRSQSSLRVKLMVQCKCYEKLQVDTRMVRELNGTYSNIVPERDRSRVFFMITSPNGFTKQGRRDFDVSPNPLIHCQVDKMNLVDPTHGAYDIENYTKSKIRSFYCNPVAEALLKGLDWNLTLKKETIDV